jgi:hypothetical protein
MAIVLGAQATWFGIETLRESAHPLHLGIAAAELLACMLLVVRRSRWVGAALLFATLAGAAVVHVVRGESPPGSFAVYGAALLVVGRSGERSAG